MAVAVVFTYSDWVARFPEFATVPEATAQQYFNEAGVLWNNMGYSPATHITTQTILMNMLTAHIAALYWKVPSQGGPGAQDPNSPVGRISSASEGSVSVSTDLGLTPSSSAFTAWLQQTKYGLEFLALTTQYRAMRYVPGALQSGGLGPMGYPGYAGRFFFPYGGGRRW